MREIHTWTNIRQLLLILTVWQWFGWFFFVLRLHLLVIHTEIFKDKIVWCLGFSLKDSLKNKKSGGTYGISLAPCWQLLMLAIAQHRVIVLDPPWLCKFEGIHNNKKKKWIAKLTPKEGLCKGKTWKQEHWEVVYVKVNCFSIYHAQVVKIYN